MRWGVVWAAPVAAKRRSVDPSKEVSCFLFVLFARVELVEVELKREEEEVRVGGLSTEQPEEDDEAFLELLANGEELLAGFLGNHSDSLGVGLVALPIITEENVSLTKSLPSALVFPFLLSGCVEDLLSIFEASDELEEFTELLEDSLVAGGEQGSLNDACLELLMAGNKFVEVADLAEAFAEGAPRGLEHFHHDVGVNTRDEVDHLVAEQ